MPGFAHRKNRLLVKAIGNRLLSQRYKLRMKKRNQQRCDGLLEAKATPIANLYEGETAGCSKVITVEHSFSKTVTNT